MSCKVKLMISTNSDERFLQFSYHIPIGDFGSGNMLDSHMFAITIANTGIDGTESAFAQDLTHSVGPFERFATGTFFQTCKSKLIY